MKKRRYDFAVIGGDMRMVYMAQSLRYQGASVRTYGLCAKEQRKTEFTADNVEEAVREADTVVLPIPVSKDETELFCQERKILLTEILQWMEGEQRIVGGCIPEFMKKQAKEKGVMCCDFMKDECLAVYNSIATAEGAIAEAITKSPLNLNKSRCMILGYGRCGKTLAAYLKGMFCHVTVCARRKEVREKALITVDHVCDFSQLEKELPECLFLFNTVPEMILGKDKLRVVNSKVCIIDIASAPYGVDFEAAGELGINAHLCSGLPGKYAPEASGEIMASMLTDRIYEKGEV